jgi:hypothetical protein
VEKWFFLPEAGAGFVLVLSTFPQTVGGLLLDLIQEHIGVCAPRMPNVRPRNAEKAGEKRPLFAVENSFLHRLDALRRAPRMPNPGRAHRRAAPRMPN